MALAAVAAIGWQWTSGSALETRTTTWADGSLREEWTVRREADGSFVRQGSFRAWYESGRLSAEGQYRDDRKTGLWQTWYDLEPRLKSASGRYVDDQKDGVWEYRMDPECRHAMASTNPEPTCRCCERQIAESSLDHPDQVERYRLGVPDGLWIAWYPNGQVSDSLVYVDGQLEGRAVSYHTSGRLAALTVYRRGARVTGIQMWDLAGNPL